MTSANPQHARTRALARGWRAYRRWRRTRPFWGGLFLLLAGLEIFQSTQASLGGLTFHLGPTGYLSWLIPTILAACGLLMWFTPQQRMFYAVVGAMTAVYSLIAVNLGGFLIGMLLGMVGSALGFAWTPLAPVQPLAGQGRTGAEDDGPVEPPVDDSTVDELMDGPLTDTLPQPRNPLRDRVETAASGDEPIEHGEAGYQAVGHDVPGSTRDKPEGPDGGRQRPGAPAARDQRGHESSPSWRNPPALMITLIMLTVAVLGAVAVPGHAASAVTCPSPVVKPTASPPVVEPTMPATLSPPPASTAPTAGPGAGLLGGISGTAALDWLMRVDGTPTPTPTPNLRPTTTPTAGTAEPASTPVTCSTRKPAAEADQPTGSIERLTATSDQPAVAERPSRLTGSTLTMTGLKLEGFVDLPTADGSLRVLKFSMQNAVTRDFQLQIPGGRGPSMVIKSSTLTVNGDVAFYTTRFAGRILGVEVVLTPESPVPPDGVDLTVPLVAFDDPDVQLAFVECDTLTAPNLDQGFV